VALPASVILVAVLICRLRYNVDGGWDGSSRCQAGRGEDADDQRCEAINS
jgi:hypothetical protein